ncbi:MAG: hypothetical protein ACYTG2_00920 [Planctomycetota bacterium]|jgi:hypothetical protein
MRRVCTTLAILGMAALPAVAQVRLSVTPPGPVPTLSSDGVAPADGQPGTALGTAVLWDQSDFALQAWLDQVFTDLPGSSGYQVCDVSTGGDAWNVTKVTTYFTQGLAGAWSPGTVTTASLQVFPKTGALPSDGGDLAPEYIVPITLVDVDTVLWRVEADTSGIAELNSISGDFWIGLTPITDYSVDGQEYHWVSTVVGGETAFRNPGGAFGLGTGWLGLSTLDTIAAGPPYEAAITLEGEVLAPGDTWVDLGPGTALLSTFWGDLPTAAGSGLASGGSTVTLSASHCGLPFAGTTLVIGLFNISFAFKGGTMVPSPDLLLPLPTGATGNITLPFSWPVGLPPGFKIYLQFWQNEPPWSASNGLEVTAL